FGLWVFALMTCTAALHTARALADRLLAIAQRQDDPGLRLEAHVACGMTCLHAGELASSLAHVEAGRALSSVAASCPCLPLRPRPRGGVPRLWGRRAVICGLSGPGAGAEL